MAALIPTFVRMKAWLAGEVPFATRVTQLLELTQRCGLPAPTSYAAPVASKAIPIARLDVNRIGHQQISLDALERNYGIALSVQKDGRVLVDASMTTEAVDEAECRKVLHALTSLLGALFDTDEVDTGFVERIESGINALPTTPLSLRNLALVVRDADVARDYREPQLFFRVWDTQRVRGDQHFLARAVDAVTTPAWFQALFVGQWTMARAARVGSVRYGSRQAPAGCEAVLLAGESCLRQVGYRDGHVELAAVVLEQSEIPPWEVLQWNEILNARKLPDGSPVTEVRAVFRDEASARRHARVLLGVRMKVVFLGADGAYHAVAEDV